MSALLLLAVLAGAGATFATEAPSTAHRPADDLQEQLLLHGEVVDAREAKTGVTRSTVATLQRDGLVHAAHVQVVDEYKATHRLAGLTEMDFRDSWRGNVAAYRLDRLLGLHMVPVSVRRSYRGKLAAFTWWLDEVLMTDGERHQRRVRIPDPEAWERERQVVRVFDQLIYNTDCNQGNLLIDEQWRLWMIDHTRAFKVFGELPDTAALGVQCEKDLLAALRSLDRAALEAAVGDVLGSGQIKGLLARRDRIVQYYDAQLAALGTARVLYDLPPRAAPARRAPADAVRRQ